MDPRHSAQAVPRGQRAEYVAADEHFTSFRRLGKLPLPPTVRVLSPSCCPSRHGRTLKLPHQPLSHSLLPPFCPNMVSSWFLVNLPGLLAEQLQGANSHYAQQPHAAAVSLPQMHCVPVSLLTLQRLPHVAPVLDSRKGEVPSANKSQPQKARGISGVTTR